MAPKKKPTKEAAKGWLMYDTPKEIPNPEEM
jgi:hypothetical protein